MTFKREAEVALNPAHLDRLTCFIIPRYRVKCKFLKGIHTSNSHVIFSFCLCFIPDQACDGMLSGEIHLYKIQMQLLVNRFIIYGLNVSDKLVASETCLISSNKFLQVLDCWAKKQF